MKYLTLSILTFTTLFLFSNCKQDKPAPDATGDQLGELHIQFTGSPEAMPHFEKGLKLLHNFEYDDARDEFVKAQELDSTLVMAYWGEAMTHNHPLWRQQDYEDGQAALGKLAETADERATLAKTDLERDFLQAMEIMYGPNGAKKERDSMYSKQLEMMYEKYPGNEEVAAFYALSLLGAVKVGRDVEAYEKGAAVVQGILKENPNHPGALHYLIHSYDDPGHAPKALPAAFSYSKVAADATHALHMPSHIFVAVGMWDEVVRSNIASWNASANSVEEDPDAKNFGSYHALHWWMYGLLQQGRYEEAKKLVDDMNHYATEKPTIRARDYLISMKGNYLAETGDWMSEVATYSVDKEDLNLTVIATDYFLQGMQAYTNENDKELIGLISKMEAERLEAGNSITAEGVPMCSAGSNRQAPNQADIDQTLIMEMELRGLLSLLRADSKKAEEWYKKAVDLETATSYSYGPPTIVTPSYELYANFLMENDRAAEAAVQYDAALNKGPKRRLALQGRLKAAKLLQEEEKVKELEAIIAEIAEKANGTAL